LKRAVAEDYNKHPDFMTRLTKWQTALQFVLHFRMSKVSSLPPLHPYFLFIFN